MPRVSHINSSIGWPSLRIGIGHSRRRGGGAVVAGFDREILFVRCRFQRPALARAGKPWQTFAWHIMSLTNPGQTSHTPRRIVLATFGSLGDLHPFLALALGLQQRGHDAVIATSEVYRPRVESLGLGFRPVRPDISVIEADAELMRHLMDMRKGTERIIRELVMPALRDSYADTLVAAEGADLLVSHALTYGVRLVAEKRGIPWASVMLSPIGFLSCHDPSILPTAQFLSKHLRVLPASLYGIFMWMGKRMIRAWARPWHDLRAQLGLPAVAVDPLCEGQHSPLLVLAMFSRLLADQQPDWPAAAVQTGFPFHDRDSDAILPHSLARFLDAGTPPIVFTLGSSAVWDAGAFYQHSAAAARALGRRAVLLTGKDPRNQPALSDGAIACDYAPFTALFPRAAAIVHQGGVGTTAQAMRAGRPMLVMPYSHDQPDNADRVCRLGIARTIAKHRYTPARAAAALKAMLDDPACVERAAEVGRQVRAEDGVGSACDAIEALWHRSGRE
jgi:rhamnosyltransferase subunit B